MASSVIVVTNCTNRKRAVGEVVALQTSDLTGSLKSVARHWTKALQKAPALDEARHVYGGRSMCEAKNAAKAAGAPLYVVSAGLGIVHESEPIPAYDLTVSPGSGSITPFLTRLGKSPADWWKSLTSEMGPNRSFQSLVENNEDKTVLLALPAGYLELISDDLSSLSSRQAKQIRVLTSKLGETYVPPPIKPYVLPYDERLESAPKYAGTRTDFPQRALLHFIREVEGHRRDFSSAYAAVLFEMASLKKRELPVRAKKSDEEIAVLLRQNWNKYDGASGRLLRFLRDEALVACEQSRFRDLWRQIQQEFATRG